MRANCRPSFFRTSSTTLPLRNVHRKGGADVDVDGDSDGDIEVGVGDGVVAVSAGAVDVDEVGAGAADFLRFLPGPEVSFFCFLLLRVWQFVSRYVCHKRVNDRKATSPATSPELVGTGRHRGGGLASGK